MYHYRFPFFVSFLSSLFKYLLFSLSMVFYLCLKCFAISLLISSSFIYLFEFLYLFNNFILPFDLFWLICFSFTCCCIHLFIHLVFIYFFSLLKVLVTQLSACCFGQNCSNMFGFVSSFFIFFGYFLVIVGLFTWTILLKLKETLF